MVLLILINYSHWMVLLGYFVTAGEEDVENCKLLFYDPYYNNVKLLNYGGQAEILHAVKEIAAEVEAGKLNVADITNNIFESHLYTKGLPAPDLLIRPGGDLRISNFLLWQIAYAEIWTTDAYWPDFSPEHLLQAIAAYQGRERRFGGLVNNK